MIEMSVKMTPVAPKRSQPSPNSNARDNVDGKSKFLEAMKGELKNQKEPTEPLAESSTGNEKPATEKPEQPATTPGLSSSMLAMLSQVMGQIPTAETIATTENIASLIATVPVEGAALNGETTVQMDVLNVMPATAPIVPQVTTELPQQTNIAQAIANPVEVESKGTKASTEATKEVKTQPQQPVQQMAAEQTVVTQVSEKVKPQTVQAASSEAKVSAPVQQQAAANAVTPKAVVTQETTTKADASTQAPQDATVVQKKEASPQAKSDTSSEADKEQKEENLANKFAPTEKIMVQKESGASLVKISDEANNLDKTPVEQVANSVKQSIDNGKKEFVIDLFPTNLGKISVKLISQGGTLLVELAAQNPKTQSMLLASSGEIKELVQATTGTITQVVAPNQNESLPQNYTQQQKEKENNSPQQQQEDGEEQNSQENPVNFMEVLQKLRQSQQIVKSY